MRIYNTLNKKIEEFIPNNNECVTMYTCGPTVYNYAHIGNLRTYISEDILEKTLILLGYNVKRCMNITDVGHLVGDGDDGDDKMQVAAQKEQKSALQIAEFYTDAFMQDLAKLNIKKPEIISKATDNIQEYIKIIEDLIQKDIAYLSNGNVYFDTSKYQDYYKLSGLNQNDLSIAVRENVEVDNNKRNPFDFGLWFTNSKFDNQELKWDSPFGLGYPGWHIECSAIALKNLGEKLDIHCGAIDAVFPHHTNEIAQSECFVNHKWCNYWVHMEFLNDQTGKMSKSKGTFLTLASLETKGYNPLVYRLFCLQSHYRKQLVFTEKALNHAQNAYLKLKNKVKEIKNNNTGLLDSNIYKQYIDSFTAALANDLNTSSALTILYDVLKDSVNNNTKLQIILKMDEVLSLGLLDEVEIDDDLNAYIKAKLAERKIAKENKDYALADKIREELEAQHIYIKDTKETTEFEIRK